MKQIIITVENQEQVNAIVENLCDLEDEGTLDFAYDCKTVEVETNNDKPDLEIPEDLQEYADHVGLNILYQNYHKSTNGVWSEVDINHVFPFEIEDENGKEDVQFVYEATIHYGCQDHERNESYSKQGYFFKTLFLGKLRPKDVWCFSYDHPQEDQS